MCFDNAEKQLFITTFGVFYFYFVSRVFEFYEHLHAITKRSVILITLQKFCFRNIIMLPVPARHSVTGHI